MTIRELQATASSALLVMSLTTQPMLAQVTPPQTGGATQQQGTTPQQPPQTGVGPQQVSPTAPTQAQPSQTSTAPTENAETGRTGLPQTPEPKATEPFGLRDTVKDYTQPRSHFRNPIAPYTAIGYPLPKLTNSQRLGTLLRDGKIYLSLADAVTLAVENNFDIEIARINLDIADTDILRTKGGSTLRGVSTGLVTGTIGGTQTAVTGGGGPGGTTTATGGGGTGASGLVLSTNGGGPQPYSFDPALTGTIQYENASTQQTTNFITGTNILANKTETYNFGYQQGFKTGTLLNVTFDQSRQSTNSIRTSFSPLLQSAFRVQGTQHLLQGFGVGLNTRFILQAKNDRRLTDSAFRQQVIYTISQIENIYWSLVSAYENEQSKERALQQSTQLSSDNRKQLEIGTLAPLDVVNSDATVASDKQALITAQSLLEYQQLLMKQAIARDLADPQLANAPVVPTDRVGLDRLPEEDTSVEDLVQQAFVNNPQIEQAVLSLKNNEITIKAFRNGLLPVIDAFGFYASGAVGGALNPTLQVTNAAGQTVPATPQNSGITPSGFGTVLQNTFNNNFPDYGVGVNITIPLRNRPAQADQARAQMELRQTQLRLQQLYIQTRINVVNGQYALTNDRASVQSAQAARDFAAQSLDAEQKKYRLGASTTANVLTQERNLASAENNLITATGTYATDRVALQQLLSNTLDRYGISLVDAASGVVSQQPAIPGLTAPKAPAPPKPISATPPPA